MLKYYVYKIVGVEITKEEYETAKFRGEEEATKLFISKHRKPVKIIEYAIGRRLT